MARLHAVTKGANNDSRESQQQLVPFSERPSQLRDSTKPSPPPGPLGGPLNVVKNYSEQNSLPRVSQGERSPSRNFIFNMIRYIVTISILLFFFLHATSITWPRVFNNLGACRLTECCHSNDGTGYILYDKGVYGLREDLRSKVHGQPLISEPIFRSLMAHLTNEKPSRPLVMYFSGWTGTGKTYVAHLIAKNLYKEGLKSRFVKYISSSFHFPVSIQGDHEIDIQRTKLRDMIREVITRCERSLIILDELDKLPAGVVDVLQPMFDYVESVDGVQYSKAIFIFLSNTGATTLNKLSYKMFQEGKERDDLKSKDIEEVLINESYDEAGGLRHSSLLKRYSIGVFVPFLPLERKHIKLCIRDKIKELYNEEQNTAAVIEDIAEEMTYFPDEIQMYSKSGCKRVSEKVINYLGPPTMLLNQTSPLVGNQEL